MLWRRKQLPTPLFLLRESHGQSERLTLSLSFIPELNNTKKKKKNYSFFFLTIPHLEKALATHSSTLAWKLPWTEEPGGLQSMGSRRVGHN